MGVPVALGLLVDDGRSGHENLFIGEILASEEFDDQSVFRLDGGKHLVQIVSRLAEPDRPDGNIRRYFPFRQSFHRHGSIHGFELEEAGGQKITQQS